MICELIIIGLYFILFFVVCTEIGSPSPYYKENQAQLPHTEKP